SRFFEIVRPSSTARISRSNGRQTRSLAAICHSCNRFVTRQKSRCPKAPARETARYRPNIHHDRAARAFRNAGSSPLAASCDAVDSPPSLGHQREAQKLPTRVLRARCTTGDGGKRKGLARRKSKR